MAELDTQDPAVETPDPDAGQAVDLETLAIPADKYKDNPTISKYKTVGEVFKGLDNANKLIGAKGVIVPKEDATDEEKSEFFNKLGRPPKPEEYKLSEVKDLHPEIQKSITPEAQGVFKSEMHKLGLTNAQADGLYKWYFENASKGKLNEDKQTDAQMKEAETKLRQDWGKDYDANLSMAKKLVAKHGGEELIKALNGADNNPVVIKFLGSIAKNFSEDQLSVDVKGVDNTNQSAAKKRISEIQKDRSGPYWNENHEDHMKAVKEVTDLYKTAYPDEVEA